MAETIKNLKGEDITAEQDVWQCNDCGGPRRIEDVGPSPDFAGNPTVRRVRMTCKECRTNKDLYWDGWRDVFPETAKKLLDYMGDEDRKYLQ